LAFGAPNEDGSGGQPASLQLLQRMNFNRGKIPWFNPIYVAAGLRILPDLFAFC